MRRLLTLALFALGGCSGEETKEAAAQTAPVETGVTLAGRSTRVEGIAMSWEGEAIRVGDSWESAQRVFQNPGAALIHYAPCRNGSVAISRRTAGRRTRARATERSPMETRSWPRSTMSRESTPITPCDYSTRNALGPVPYG